ncbi:hypothetical protein SBA_ch1_15780 [Sphingomonas bisphenolicum]|uniref:Uncharacterized protein n=1 Tax=Sphingomonas bisphenolicum TaxID=296544 RepID=A0ABM7G3Z1_9SPHN|nr:hypothetical protein SBA_ch1_15780 [Sphingomonas bisphenolicum]
MTTRDCIQAARPRDECINRRQDGEGQKQGPAQPLPATSPAISAHVKKVQKACARQHYPDQAACNSDEERDQIAKKGIGHLNGALPARSVDRHSE